MKNHYSYYFIMSNSKFSSKNEFHWRDYLGIASIGLGVSLLGFAACRYKVCSPNQYMIKTGLGIPDMKVAKRGVVWPFQKYQIIDFNPRNYSFDLHHISRDKMPFNLPISLTVGPYNPDDKPDLFRNFARKMTRAEGNDLEIESTVKSVVNGEIRILSASRSIEELFSDRKIFRSCIVEEVQKDLDLFGVAIFNANIEEMKDMPGNSYFEFRKKRAIESANNEARVDVAEALKKGEIGEKENQAIASQTIAKVDAETIRVQNAQALSIAESKKELEVKKAGFYREVEIAKVTAMKEAEKRQMELQQEVDKRRIAQQEEALRADHLARSKIDAESKITEAKGDAEALRQKTDAQWYAESKKADAAIFLASAEAKGIQLKLAAEASGISAKGKAEAESIQAKYEAESQGMQQLLSSCGDNIDLIRFNMALQSKLPQILAEANAKAINDLKPNINIWQRDSSTNNALDPIANIAMAIPQIAKTIQQQTGIQLPDFLSQLPKK